MPYKDEMQQKESQHESYLRNKERVRQSSKDCRDRRKKEINDYKELHPCMDCGVRYPHFVMDFDHRDASTKIGSVATLLTKLSMKKIWEEIEKCDLVCSNCHRIRTQSRL